MSSHNTKTEAKDPETPAKVDKSTLYEKHLISSQRKKRLLDLGIHEGSQAQQDPAVATYKNRGHTTHESPIVPKKTRKRTSHYTGLFRFSPTILGETIDDDDIPGLSLDAVEQTSATPKIQYHERVERPIPAVIKPGSDSLVDGQFLTHQEAQENFSKYTIRRQPFGYTDYLPFTTLTHPFREDFDGRMVLGNRCDEALSDYIEPFMTNIRGCSPNRLDSVEPVAVHSPFQVYGLDIPFKPETDGVFNNPEISLTSQRDMGQSRTREDTPSASSSSDDTTPSESPEPYTPMGAVRPPIYSPDSIQRVTIVKPVKEFAGKKKFDSTDPSKFAGQLELTDGEPGPIVLLKDMRIQYHTHPPKSEEKRFHFPKDKQPKPTDNIYTSKVVGLEKKYDMGSFELHKTYLCSYCPKPSFFPLKNSSYLHHLQQIHGITSRGKEIPDPLHYGVYKYQKWNRKRTQQKVQYTDGAVCPDCKKVVTLKENKKEEDFHRFKSYLRHYEQNHLGKGGAKIH